MALISQKSLSLIMSFKTRTIRPPSKSHSLGKISPLRKGNSFGKVFRISDQKKGRSGFVHHLMAGGLLVLGMVVVVKVTLGAYHFLANFTPASVLEVIGSDLKKDEHGYTNILLLGDGGYEREGAGLVDTIMIASIDYKKNAVSMLSVPRDFYVSKEINLGLDRYGKINQIYNNYNDLDESERFEKFKVAAGSLANLDIQYFMRVDFKGFVEIVDALGGITIDVPQAIDDLNYPNATDTGFSPFHIKAGLQELDGEKALKYARSRHTTSDFDRAARQQLILEAIRQKALSKDILTDPAALKEIYEAVQKNFTTDLSFTEMASLGAFAQKLDRSHIVLKQLSNSEMGDGGFLYDGVRALYGGASVLVPKGDDLQLIHQYADLIFNHREIYYNKARIQVLNATKSSGVARELANELIRFGFNVEEVSNYEDGDGERAYLEESRIEYSDWTETKNGKNNPKFQSTLNVLRGFVQASVTASSTSQMLPMNPEEGQSEKIFEGSGINVTLILGEDYYKK